MLQPTSATPASCQIYYIALFGGVLSVAWTENLQFCIVFIKNSILFNLMHVCWYWILTSNQPHRVILEHNIHKTEIGHKQTPQNKTKNLSQITIISKLF